MENFFNAIKKLILTIVSLGTYKVDSAANSIYTSSSDGIKAGYQQSRDGLIDNSNQLIDGMSDLEALLVQKQEQLKELDEKEQENENTIEGIILFLEKNPDDKQARVDFERLDTLATEIDEKQEYLGKEVDTLQAKVDEYEMELKKMQDQIHDLKAEEAESIADHALMAVEEKLLEKEKNFKNSVDMSPVQAIREARAKRKAKVNTIKKVVGSDTGKRMDRYANAGQKGNSNKKLDEILAQRKAKKAPKQIEGATPINNEEIIDVKEVV
jgi:DNA repair exonuclease SbcCD ATPase subunit